MLALMLNLVGCENSNPEKSGSSNGNKTLINSTYNLDSDHFTMTVVIENDILTALEMTAKFDNETFVFDTSSYATIYSEDNISEFIDGLQEYLEICDSIHNDLS